VDYLDLAVGFLYSFTGESAEKRGSQVRAIVSRQDSVTPPQESSRGDALAFVPTWGGALRWPGT
jgi:hypothetical protein